MAASAAYRKYIGLEVFTKYPTVFNDASGKPVNMGRLSTFKIVDVRAQRVTHYVKMTLRGLGSGKTYTKQVTFVSHDVSGDIAGTHEDLYDNLFTAGNPLDIPGVEKAHLLDIRKGVVRAGFSEAEVTLAMGEPTSRGDVSNELYSWVYKNPAMPYACVFFNKNTKKVRSIKK
jgi:hypothetical protein